MKFLLISLAALFIVLATLAGYSIREKNNERVWQRGFEDGYIVGFNAGRDTTIKEMTDSEWHRSYKDDTLILKRKIFAPRK